MQSFQSLADWYALAKGAVGQRGLRYAAVLANKADLSHLRAVRPDKHNAFVQVRSCKACLVWCACTCHTTALLASFTLHTTRPLLGTFMRE